jgi:hypothetical protein
LNLPFSYNQAKILPSSFRYGIKADTSSDNVVGRYYESGLNINAGHEELDLLTPLITYNQPGMYGAGFTFVANYKFYNDLSVLSWINTNDFNPCLKFWYLYYFVDTSTTTDNHIAKKLYGIFCPFITTADPITQTYITSGDFVGISKLNLPTADGLNI